MKNFATDDPHPDFESGLVSAQTSEAKTGAPDAERSRETNASGDRPDGAGCHAADASDPAADSRGNAKEAVEEKIKITPEMKEAGADVLMRFTGDSERYWAEIVYLAMEGARTG